MRPFPSKSVLVPLLFLIAFVSFGCGSLGGPGPAQEGPAPSAPIGVSTSDSDVEKQLAAYFTEVKDWVVDFKVFSKNADDVYLSLPWTTTEDGPTMYVTVDTSPSAGSIEEGGVREMRIRVGAVFKYQIGEDHPQRAAALEALNAYQAEYWTPRVYLDEDGDLVLESSVNVPGSDYPVHPEVVADAIERTSAAWEGLMVLLAKYELPVPQNF